MLICSQWCKLIFCWNVFGFFFHHWFTNTVIYINTFLDCTPRKLKQKVNDDRNNSALTSGFITQCFRSCHQVLAAVNPKKTFCLVTVVGFVAQTSCQLGKAAKLVQFASKKQDIWLPKFKYYTYQIPDFFFCMQVTIQFFPWGSVLMKVTNDLFRHTSKR